jgi:crotonobetainyl-CoA:carnitine CoA-transferase CaiB-like acyl-CoA transferase
LQRYILSNGTDVMQQAGRHFPGLTIYGSFAAVDGYLVIAAQIDDAWNRLAKLVGGERLALDDRFRTIGARNSNREAAITIVEQWVRAQASRDDCISKLEAIGVACAPVQTASEVVGDGHLADRDMFIEQDHPTAGKVRLPGTPFSTSFHVEEPALPAPMLGQHNEQIAALLGYTADEIHKLRRTGVLRSGDQ